MQQPLDRFEAGWRRGEQHAKLESRVKSLEDWREKVEGYASGILSYLKRGMIVAVLWLLGAVTAALPGSPLAALAELGKRLLTGD